MSLFLRDLEGERPSDQTFMDIAAKWLNDPMGTRTLFVNEVLGNPTPENPATVPEVINAMRRATLSQASALAWLRGEQKAMGGPMAECEGCTEYLNSIGMPQPVPVPVQTIWMGKDHGGWCCMICGNTAQQLIPIPEPFIPPNLKELPN